MIGLAEIDSLEAIVIIDNELDVLSPMPPNTVGNTGGFANIMQASPHVHDRGNTGREVRMDSVCCAAHGLSIMLTATRGSTKHTILFDAGPEEDAWERNVRRLAADVSSVEVIQLSHWHRDHSGGLLKAIQMIKEGKKENHLDAQEIIMDLHPARPDYRGFMIAEQPVSMEADPTFEELQSAGARIQKSSIAHTVLDDMFLISGEIPRVTPYETGLRNSIRFDKSTNLWSKDESMTDERFLMCNLKGKGLIVLTGCAHAGVVNTAKNAVELLGGSIPLYAVVGGFHLAQSGEEQIQQSIKDLKDLKPAILMPGHCTGWRAKYEIERTMPGQLVPCTVGAKLKF